MFHTQESADAYDPEQIKERYENDEQQLSAGKAMLEMAEDFELHGEEKFNSQFRLAKILLSETKLLIGLKATHGDFKLVLADAAANFLFDKVFEAMVAAALVTLLPVVPMSLGFIMGAFESLRVARWAAKKWDVHLDKLMGFDKPYAFTTHSLSNQVTYIALKASLDFVDAVLDEYDRVRDDIVTRVRTSNYEILDKATNVFDNVINTRVPELKLQRFICCHGDNESNRLISCRIILKQKTIFYKTAS
jgi:hypothetical protein